MSFLDISNNEKLSDFSVYTNREREREVVYTHTLLIWIKRLKADIPRATSGEHY